MYHGQYKEKEKVPTVTMEVICDDRLYFWRTFFGVAGCNNDITVLNASSLINKISNGEYLFSVSIKLAKKRSTSRTGSQRGYLQSVLALCTRFSTRVPRKTDTILIDKREQRKISRVSLLCYRPNFISWLNQAGCERNL